MYSVVRKRHCRVMDEDMLEGEKNFVVRMRLPVVESFGLTNELRERTSGMVSLPQLRPGGWEVLDIDPLQPDDTGKIAILSEKHIKIWEYQKETIERLFPSERDNAVGTSVQSTSNAVTTKSSDSSSSDDEEVEDENLRELKRLHGYLRQVRKRNGITVNEQLVISADKQRTLKKNK